MTRILSLVRAASSKRLQYQSDILERLSADTITQRYFRGESTALPEFYRSKIRQDLGALWQALPEGAVEHDQNAYLRKSAQGTVLQAMKSSNSPLTAALARSQA
jgi:hypothetical protein